MFLSLGIANLTLVGLSIWAYLTFGSIYAAVGFLRGDGLAADTATQSFGVAKPGSTSEMIFNIRNITRQPITILGAATSCNCLVVDSLPKKLGAGETYPLKVRIRIGPKLGDFHQDMELFTDYPTQPSMPLELTGIIVGSE